MSQTRTTRFLFRSAPGHITTPAQERETESIYAPFIAQQLTITLAGADPFAADADLTITYPLQDGSGSNGTVTLTIPAATTLAAAAALVAAAWNASPQAAQLYTATSALAVVTLVARSYNTSIAPGLITGVFTDAHTATVAQSVAASAPTLVMGRFYQYATVAQPLAIGGTPRDCHAATSAAGATITSLRGVVGREMNSTMLPLPNSASVPDFYPAGQPAPGLLRGEVWVQVDPASATVTSATEIHVVVDVGAYSMVGAVAAAADGANTVRVDNAPAGNVLARFVEAEENLQPFSTSSGRFVKLKVNQTN